MGAKTASGAAIGAAALAITASARAQAVAYHFSSNNVAGAGGANALYLDFTTGTLSSSRLPDYTFKITPTTSHNDRYGYARIDPVAGNVMSGAEPYATKFSPGTYSFTNSPYSSAYLYEKSRRAHDEPVWQNVTGGFLGVEVYRNSTYYFGWIQIDTNDDASVIKVDAFGYNQTPGAPSLVGSGVTPVPEPAATAILLAAGAAGVVLYRRRRGKIRVAAKA